MNKVILTGNLGHAASTRMVAKRDGSGSTPVVNFSLAARVGWGESERTQWWDCAWWGPRAEKCAAWLTQGTRVLVVGEPDVRQFTKRDGTPGVALTATVHELEPIGAKREANAGGQAAEPSVTMVPGGTDRSVTVMKEDKADVPY